MKKSQTISTFLLSALALGCAIDTEDGAIRQKEQAFGPGGPSGVPTLNALVRRGADLFFNETFNGNGRTCGSCHRADNNFTIDAKLIATLPANDPLFVAEFMPALAENFEKPALMRALGLFVENVDGLDNLAEKFTMRSVTHTLGLAFSLTPSEGDGSTTPPNQRTGWSGDGAPGNGTLREFAIGAVVQHFPLTLARQAGSDFRLPTEEELDAMEAFQLFIGRDEELNLATLSLIPAMASTGQALFVSPEARCNACHENAGANASFGDRNNRNFNTGVEDFPDPCEQVDPNNCPPDGGFGQDPLPGVPGAFGNGTFNSVSLVEAADTGPFFHNNIVETIEEAVAFYNSDAFNNSPSGTPNIALSNQQVAQIAAFLRVINALENIRSARETIQFMASNSSDPTNSDLFVITLAEIDDALEVLEAPSGHLSGAARHNLATARLIVFQAQAHPPGALQAAYLNISLTWLELARQALQN